MARSIAEVGPPDVETATAVIVELGRGLHEAGTASDSLEAILESVAKAIGVELQVLDHPTSLIAAIGPANRQTVAIQRLDTGGPNLEYLARLNGIANRLIDGTLSATKALPAIRAVLRTPRRYPGWLIVLAYCAAAMAVAVLLNGAWIEVAVGAVIGLATGLLSLVTGRFGRLAYLFELIAATIAAVIAIVAGPVVGPLETYTTIAAGVAVLLPGLTITTAVSELATRNLISGTARLGGAFTTLVSLTAGVAIGTGIGLLLGGQIQYGDATPLSDWLLVPVVLFAAFAFGVVLNGRPIDFRWIVPSCAIAVAASRLTEPLTPQAAAILSALLLGLGAQFGARVLRLPAEVLTVPGLLVLVPGVIGYQGLLLLLQADVESGVTFLFNMLLTALLLVAGLLASRLFVLPRMKAKGT
jgi:uncharacterized membrane protein YjjP (DUF1212 family)